jgi:Tol biopolymer transport system component
MALTSGTRFGSYEISDRLGAGGMGEVYRARDTKLGRDVAVKTLPSALASDKERLARFEREAKLLAALNHPHIATVHALDEHDGTLYVAMELVEGQTLEEKLKSGALPVEDGLRLALQIAEALEAAHGKGVIHRDLKPANVMVTRDGQVKVLDFGLAKAFSGAHEEASPLHSPALSVAMTQKGLVLGTAGYMSPEQASGQATDQRSDIWAFGVVLYEMLTGLPLFSGESVPHILADVLKTEPDWKRLPKNLHPRIRALLERCLTKKPRNRLHSIADARVEIEGVLGDPRGVTPEIAVDAGGPRSSGVLRLAGAVAATAIIAGIVGWWLRPLPAPEPKLVNRLVYPVPATHTIRNIAASVLAFSPDGRRFVYNTFDGLYVRSMDELEARRLPGTEENLASPFFSPDGQSVAYWTVNGQQLKRVALTGGAPVIIASDLSVPLGASWEADGTIIFGQADGIYRVSANGGTPELVVAAQEGERLSPAALLPGGDAVLFSATTTPSWNEAQIAVQSLSTGERTGLISGGSDVRYLPTGHLVYALGDGLFAVAFDAATLTVSGGPVSLVQGVVRAIVTGAASYGISNDGTLVYITGVSGALLGAGYTPVWVDHDGREEPLGLATCFCASPAVAPNGARLAYDFPNADTSDADVWIWSLAQHTNTRLTFEPSLQLGAVWSPDSTRIAYTSLGQGLFMRPADGTGTAEPLLESSNTIVAWAWTADDELIISEVGSSGADIAVLSLTGDRERRPLLTSQFNEYRPALSPDARWLAYQSDESGQNEIYVRPFPEVGAGKWQVSSGGGQEPKWSRDGRTLFYLGPSSLMEAAVRDGASFTYDTSRAVLNLQPYAFTDLPPRRYDVSPDGQRFLLMRQSGVGADGDVTPAQVVVVTNWVEELKQRVPTK